MPSLLLVEDDESNRLTLTALLEEEGYLVTPAGGVEEARRILENAGGRFDLVLLDQKLGDGTGPELVPLIRERHPRVKVAVMSGEAPDAEVLKRVDGFLPKGIGFAALAAALQALLAG